MCRRREWDEMLRIITPELVAQRDKWGNLVLFKALKHSAPLNILLNILNALPEAVNFKSWDGYPYNGQMVLHHAARFGAPLEFVLEVINLNSSAAKEWDYNHLLPFDVAIEHQAADSVIKAIGAAYPVGRSIIAKVNEDWESLGEDVVALTISLITPESAARKDFFGFIPLHYALFRKAPLAVLDALLHAYPDGAQVGATGRINNHKLKGVIPLHIAAEKAPLPFIMHLLQVYPNGAHVLDGNGNIPTWDVPLHKALSEKASLVVLKNIFQACPFAVKVKDSQGRLPLHCVQKETPLDFVVDMLTAYPESVQQTDLSEDIALQIAIANGVPQDILSALLCADLPFSATTLQPNMIYAQSWTIILDHPVLPVDQAKFLVKYVFDQYPAFVDSLINAKDIKGREAIHICHESIQLLMKEHKFFCKRYDVNEGPPVHKSATAVVKYALDYLYEPPMRVAIKFMKEACQFEREIRGRTEACLHSDYVLDILNSFDGSTPGENYAQYLSRLGLAKYNHCLILPAADRSLKDIIDKERIAGRHMDVIRMIIGQVSRALQHLHSKGRIHGDLKPLNVVRIGELMKLIDLDASAVIGSEFAASKFSTAYLPPELISELGGVRQNEIIAHPSQDMWALGCVFFQLVAAEPLWLANDEDNLTDLDNLITLHQWTNDTKNKRIRKIVDKNARDLCSQLLSFHPHKRPASMEHVLSHPFFTGRNICRTSVEEASFDVFLSYRVDCDLYCTEKLHDLLVARGLTVWWDKRSLLPGVPWETGFCTGLVKSRCFVPLLSRNALKTKFEVLTRESNCDNVLLEYMLAIELQQRCLLDRIFPLFLGDLSYTSTGQEYGNYFSQGCHPSLGSSGVVVRSVESKLAEMLDMLGLGLMICESLTVSDILGAITRNQGGFVEGKEPIDVLLSCVADIITKMVKEIPLHGLVSSGESDFSSRLQTALLERDQAIAFANNAKASQEIAEMEIKRLQDMLRTL